jgi:hypothetical protein
VELHEGHIGLISKGKGSGCEFYFDLKLSKLEESSPVPSQQPPFHRPVARTKNAIVGIPSDEAITYLPQVLGEQDENSSAFGHEPSPGLSLLKRASSRFQRLAQLDQENPSASASLAFVGRLRSQDLKVHEDFPFGLRVLVVDDSTATRKMAVKLLSSIGCSCTGPQDHDV